MADAVAGLDEGAPDIVVADDAELERDAGLDGIAERGRDARIGHRDDDVGGDRALARQLGADPLARLVDAAALDDAVGTGEVDVFEDAEPPRAAAEGVLRTNARGVDDDELAGLDVAHEVGADDVERAGFRGEDVALAEPAEDERPDAERIAHADHHVVGQRHQRIGALDLLEGLDQPVDDVAARRRRHQVGDDLGVGGRLEQRAALDQLVAQRIGIGQVAVVGDGEAAGGEVGEQRLDVAQDGVAGGGIADMADRGMAAQPAHHRLGGEAVGDLAEVAMGVEVLAVEGDDAGRLLPAMLQGMQPEHGVRRCLADAADAEDAAFLPQMIVIQWIGADRRQGRDGVGLGHRCIESGLSYGDFVPWMSRFKSLRSLSL